MSDVDRHEPDPVFGGEEVYPRVMRDIEKRVLAAEKEHGGRLSTDNGRDALMDAYQEAIDTVFYIAQAIMEREAGNGR